MDQENSRSTLRSLLNSRYFCVLATSRDDRPYTNLVAFAVSDDLREIIFATPRQSRKYENLRANPHVAVLVDNRANEVSDLQDAVAATAIGVVTEPEGSGREQCMALYTARHPHLGDFATSASSAVFRVTVDKYIMVSTFQKVVEIAV